MPVEAVLELTCQDCGNVWREWVYAKRPTRCAQCKRKAKADAAMRSYYRNAERINAKRRATRDAERETNVRFCTNCGIVLPPQKRGAPRKRCHACRRVAELENARASTNRYREANREKVRSRAARRRQEDPELFRGYARKSYYKRVAKEHERGARYRGQNREYLRMRDREIRRSKREATSEFAGHRRWTPEEDALVSRSDLLLMEMAFALKRTYNSIESRRATLRKKGLIT